MTNNKQLTNEELIEWTKLEIVNKEKELASCRTKRSESADMAAGWIEFDIEVLKKILSLLSKVDELTNMSTMRFDNIPKKGG